MGWPRAREADAVSSPRIIFSTPFAVISYFLIWFVPDISRGQVMWYLVFYCLFQTLVTVSWALRLPEQTGHTADIPCPPELRGTPRSCPKPVLPVPLQCFHVPYSALTMFISREQSERDSATAYRKHFLPFLAVSGGQLLGAVLVQELAGLTHRTLRP